MFQYLMFINYKDSVQLRHLITSIFIQKHYSQTQISKMDLLCLYGILKIQFFKDRVNE